MHRALLVVGSLLAPVLPALAQAPTVTYAGTLACDAMTASENRRLTTPIRITIRGTAAQYEREIIRGTSKTGRMERGSGTVAANGAMSLTGAGDTTSHTFTAKYDGTVTGGTVRLSGTQTWTPAQGRTGSAETRTCTIEARAGT